MKTILCLISFLIACLAFGQKKISLSSPDKQLVFNFGISQSKPVYSVSYKHQVLIENSSLTLLFSDNSFAKISGKAKFYTRTPQKNMIC